MAILDRQWLARTRMLARPGRAHEPALLVSLPAQVDESNASEVRAALLAAAERRPRVLIADMSATQWCDAATAEAGS